MADEVPTPPRPIACPLKLLGQCFSATPVDTNCVRDACAWWVPIFGPDGKVVAGGCGVALVPSAVMGLPHGLTKLLEEAAAPQPPRTPKRA